MIYRFGRFEIDTSARELRADGGRIETEPKAFDLLVYLVEHRDRAVSKDELLSELWPRQIVTETALTRAVMKARRAIGDDSDSQGFIRTLHGHGYRFVADLAVAADAPAAGPGAPAARRRLLPGFLAAGVLAVLVIAGVYFFDSDTAEPAGTLAVLPVVDDSGDPELAWVRVGLMSLMSRMLDDAGVDVVSEKALLRSIDDLQLETVPDATTLATLRRRTGADSILHTTLDQRGGLHRLSAVITQADGRRTRRIIVGESPAALAAELSKVVSRLETSDADRDRRFRKVSADPFVNELYARGLDLELQGELDPARQLFELAAAQEPELFWLRYEIALCTRDLGEPERAQDMFEALALEAQDGADAGALVATLNSHGVLHLERSQPLEAQRLFQSALAAASERGLARDRLTVLTNLALVATRLGELGEARNYYSELFELTRDIGDTPSPFSMNNYAGLLMQTGELDEAEVHSRAAVEEFKALGYRRYVAPATNRLSKILRQRGDLDGAVAKLSEAVQIYRDLGNRPGEVSAQSSMTSIFRDRGDLTRARINAHEVLDGALETGDEHLVANAHLQIGYVESDAGDLDAALPHFEGALAGFRQQRNDAAIRAATSAIADLALRRGDYLRASTLATEIGRDAAAHGNEAAAARARFLEGRISAASGDAATAAEIYAEVLALAEASRDQSLQQSAAMALAELEIGRSELAQARRLLDEHRPALGKDHDFMRLDARLAIAEGDPARASTILLELRRSAGESWGDDDAALLSGLAGAQ